MYGHDDEDDYARNYDWVSVAYEQYIDQQYEDYMNAQYEAWFNEQQEKIYQTYIAYTSRLWREE